MALEEQRAKHIVVENEIKDLIKKIKKGEVSEISQIYGTTIIATLKDRKDILKLLEERFGVFQNSIKGIDGQILLRKDHLYETVMKLNKFTKETIEYYDTKEEQYKEYVKEALKEVESKANEELPTLKEDTKKKLTEILNG